MRVWYTRLSTSLTLFFWLRQKQIDTLVTVNSLSRIVNSLWIMRCSQRPPVLFSYSFLPVSKSTHLSESTWNTILDKVYFQWQLFMHFLWSNFRIQLGAVSVHACVARKSEEFRRHCPAPETTRQAWASNALWLCYVAKALPMKYQITAHRLCMAYS